jgi:rod shape-determining protein MreC
MFVGCLILAIAALFSPERITGGLANGLRQTILAPVVWLQEEAELGRGSRARLRELLAERDSAAYAAQVLPSLAAENERLRNLLGLSHRLRTPYVAAEVLHQAQVTDARMLLLNVGTAQGVAGFDPIVAPEGLIGVIWNASRSSSVAMTWAHPEFRVSAFTANGSAFGIVAVATSGGGSDAYLEFRGVPYRDSVVPGTVVLSSGLGGVYPKGIPIGTVVGVIREEAGWARVYRVRPAANPGSTAHVLVLTGRRVGSVAEAYPVDTLEPAARPDSAPLLKTPAAPGGGNEPKTPARARADSAGKLPSRAKPDSAGKVPARAKPDSAVKPKPKPKPPAADSTRPAPPPAAPAPTPPPKPAVRDSIP